MDNVAGTGYNQVGGFGLSDLILARGADRGSGYGGYGGAMGGVGLGGSSFIAAEGYANGTATKTAIDCHSAQFMSGLDRVSDQNKETRDTLRFDAINKGLVDCEFRNIDRTTALSNLMIQGQKDAALCCCDAKLEALRCCCETQKLITAEASATRELINQNTIRVAVDANNITATVGGINAAAAANTAAIINAITSCAK